MSTLLRLEAVTCRLGGVDVLRGVDLEVESGTLTAVVGPNGAGKSTLLAAMAGDVPAVSGTVTLDGRALASWPAAELARRRSVLTQANTVSFGFTVREVVEMGRHPWSGQADVARDLDVVDAALAATDTMHLEHRSFRTLSGGEQARASLARVLAQDAELVLLDEPTASLDLRHTEDVLRLARSLVREGRTVVVVAHDLSLASAHADELVVVADGRVTARGAPSDVLTSALVRSTYGLEVSIHEIDGRLVVVPTPEPEQPQKVTP